MGYRYCMVPKCKSTTIATPSKTFITVPLDKKKRKIWLKAARRDPKGVSAKSNLSICEDHFNLEKDLENFMEWKMMGVPKRMKKDVVPHIFACQTDRKRALDHPVRDVVLKRARQEIIHNVLRDQPNSSKCNLAQESIIKQSEEGIIEQAEDTLKHRSTYVSVGTQVSIRPKYRSKLLQCNLPSSTVCQSCWPIKQNTTSSIGISPIKPSKIV